MREVEDVVGDELVIGLDVKPAGPIAPARVAVERKPQDVFRVGLFGRTHPHPDELVLFEDGPGLDPHRIGDSVLPGNFDTAPAVIEFEPVIHAANAIRLQASHGKRRMPVAAAIVHDNGIAGVVAVGNQRLAQNRAAQQ